MNPAVQANPLRWQALGVMLLAAFMDLLDTTIVNVAIPSIQQSLGATYAQLQWVVAGYTLAFALTLITAGRLGDIYGRKRMFLSGVGGFVLASALCGLAPDPAFLIAVRLLQGVAAAIMIPQILSIIQVSFPAREAIGAYGLYGAITGIAAVAGPVLGGLLTQSNLWGLEWRSIFLLNIPVGLVALALASRLIQESKAPHALKLDLVGVGLVTLGLFLLVYPLVQGSEQGWPAWSFALMAVSLLVLGLFLVYERYKTRLDGSPLVELGLFGSRGFSAGLLVTVFNTAGIAGFALPFVLFLQIGFGFSPLQAGLAFLPFSLGSMLASGLAVPFGPRLGRNLLMLGAAISTISFLALMGVLQHYGSGLHSAHLILPLAGYGIGFGLIIVPLTDIVLAGVPEREAGSASGVLGTAQQLGNAIGVAVVGVVFFGLLGSQAPQSVAQIAPQMQMALQSMGLPASAQGQILEGFSTCFQDRMAERDPSVVPVSCQAQRVEPQLSKAVEPIIRQAVQINFSQSLRKTLWLPVGLYLACLALIFLLPLRAREHPAG